MFLKVMSRVPFLIECWECVSPLDDEGDDDDQCLRSIDGRLFSSCGRAGPGRRRGGFWVRKRRNRVDKDGGRSEAGWLQEMQFEKKNE